MVANCPKCNAENREEATFCDACGASLSTQSDGDATPNVSGNAGPAKVNFGGIAVIVIVIGVIGWMVFGPNEAPVQTATAGGGGGGSTAANPHGGQDASATGASDEGMNQMMEGIADAKVRLDADPLDTEALMTLYRTFGTIGRQDQIRPRLDAAIESLVAQAGELEPEVLSTTLSEIAYAAFYGTDFDGVEHALTSVGKAAPDNLGIMSLSGDVYFDITQEFGIDLREESIAAYTSYLLEANPETQGASYWNARTDRATMILQAGTEGSDQMKVQEALNEFKAVTQAKPDFFNAWFNLGLASNAVGDPTAAEAAFDTCVFLASNEMEGYQVALQLAAIRGEDPPAPPPGLAPPTMGGGDTGGGMANPHGGDDTGGAAASPHGGMDMGGGDTSGGMANPHGGA